MNGEGIRVLFVGKTKEARRLGDLLEPNGASPFQILQVSGTDSAPFRNSAAKADILLLDLGGERTQVRAMLQAAQAAAPDLPIVILSESEDETLAMESLQQGVQDFLSKENLDCAALTRALRFSIERHRLQKTLQTLSLVDELTGLNNRRGFLALAEQHLRVVLRKGAALLVYLDLDDLKTINDTFGHQEGNRALVDTANILRACFRKSDILARLGGDEFCVLMTDAGQGSEQLVRKRLRQRLDLENQARPENLRISFSVGMANVLSVDRSSLEEWLRVADRQMYEEKKNKPPRGAFSPTLKDSTFA